MKVTVLGCGASLGTPASGGFWGACDPAEPKNARSRASILVQSEKTNILVDASYDLRMQLNRVGLNRMDGVLLSHSHSDHINGLDDLRIFSYHASDLVNVYSDDETISEIIRRWPYLFSGGGEGVYPPCLRTHKIGFYQKISIGDIELGTFEQEHKTCKTLGFRFGNLAYSVDTVDLNEKSLAHLKGIETWIVDGGGYHNENVSTHANLKRVMKWVEILKPKMTYLTVMTTRMDYKTLCGELPAHIRPAYDGLEIEVG